MLKDLDVRLNQLKALYEQWFQGYERLPPVKRRDALERELLRARKNQPLNTALKFRFQTLWQRWTTLSTHWQRVTRQIEEGTYKRDIQRMKRRRKRREERAQPRGSAVEIDVDLDSFDLDAEVASALDALVAPEPIPEDKTQPNITLPEGIGLPQAPGAKPPPAPGARRLDRHVDAVSAMPPPVPVSKPAMDAAADLPPPKPIRRAAPPPPGPSRAAPPPPPPPRPRAGGAGLDEAAKRAIYEKYVEARKKNKERVDHLRYEKLASQIEKMVPKLAKKHRGKRIDFEVVVKDGRVGLKPVAKD